MRYRAEGGQWAAAWLHADPSVLRQIIIDKYPATGQYVRLLLQNNITDVSVSRPDERQRSYFLRYVRSVWHTPSNCLWPIHDTVRITTYTTYNNAYGIPKSNDCISSIKEFV